MSVEWEGDKILHVTVGLPRSGKSTWAKKQGHPIVCPDAIRYALHGGEYNKAAERMVWTMAEYFITSLFAAGHDDVILDATNIDDRSRGRWVQHGARNNYEPSFVYIDTPVETCIARATEKGQSDLVPVIWMMFKKKDWGGEQGEMFNEL
jgi:predicted kinase